MSTSPILRHRHEEANQEQDHDQQDEGDRILERPPESLPQRLPPLFRIHLIVLLVPKVRERHHKQHKEGIQRVKEVIHNLDLLVDPVHRVLRCPFFPAAEFGGGRGGDESDIDGEEEEGREEGEERED